MNNAPVRLRSGSPWAAIRRGLLRHRPAPDSLQPAGCTCSRNDGSHRPGWPRSSHSRRGSIMDRRDVLRWLPAGAMLGTSMAGALRAAGAQQADPEKPAAARGLPPLKVTDVKAIMTAPNRIRLVVVKVSTSEPGLYGLGCATFTQRAYAVHTAVEKYLKPFLIGRNPDEIEDIWQSSYVSSYWRNGPVLFNAMSGVDMALWDIKGKRAGMPVYQLLGGKCRFAAALYAHTNGRDAREVEDRVRAAMEKGYRHVRVQLAIPGVATYGARGDREVPRESGAGGP